MSRQSTSTQANEVRGSLDQTEILLKSIAEELRFARRPVHAAQKTMQRVASSVPTSQNEFRSFGHFLGAVKNHGHAWQQHKELSGYVSRMKSTPAGLSEVVGADGGFLIPPEFSSQLLMRVYDNDLLSRTTMFPIGTSNSLKIPAINETSRADGSRFGGVQAYWRGEAATVTATKPNFELLSIDPHPLSLFVRMTEELAEDSGGAVETYVDTVATQELEFKVGDALINGTGAGMPLGIMKSPSKVPQAKDSGQTAGTLTTSNITNMWSRLHKTCRPNAVWLVDQSIEPQLFQITLGNYPIYMPPGGLSAAPYGTLLGKPVIVTEFGQQLGTEGDIILTDLSTVITASRGGMVSGVSMHIFWLTNEASFRFNLRLDGRSWWTSSLTPKSGGKTQSNVVTLASRS